MTTWESVLPLWKKGSNFDKSKLESTFPCEPKAKSQRYDLWKGLDGNGNGYVSLAEYDAWFNKETLKVEAKEAKRTGAMKSTLFVYARPALIRAFTLANGVEQKNKKNGNLDDDDYVTKSEFALLLMATQCALRIYRLFDIADDGNDRKVSREEWKRNLSLVNSELKSFGFEGKALTFKDYEILDADGSDQVMLDEAVTFFLDKICDNSTLLRESEKQDASLARKRRAEVLKKMPITHNRPKTPLEEEPVLLSEPADNTPFETQELSELSHNLPSTYTLPFTEEKHISPPIEKHTESPRQVSPRQSIVSPRQPALLDNFFQEQQQNNAQLRLQYGNVEICLRRLDANATMPTTAPIELDFAGLHLALTHTKVQKNTSTRGRSAEPNTKRRIRSRSNTAPSQKVHDHDDDLPKSWSKRFDPKKQRYYYVDHATRTTTWHKPTSFTSSASTHRSSRSNFSMTNNSLWDPAVY